MSSISYIDCFLVKELKVLIIIHLISPLQYVKCGFAGENFPTSVFPCVVGKPMLRYDESLMDQELKVGIFKPRQVDSPLLCLHAMEAVSVNCSS